jgi:hypothetical protein
VPSEGDDDLVSIDVGFDRFHAQLLAEACRAEGCTVELLVDDLATATGQLVGMPNRLLVRRSEVETIEAIIALSH